MKCVVLAAGYATRLYPLTENFPKPLLKVNGVTILDHLLLDIDKLDEIDGYVIISNHKFVNHFCDWKKESKLTKPISIIDDGTVDNEHRLGAVKDIDYAIDKEKLDDDLLVIAGDNVLDFTFKHFVDFFKEKKTSCIMCYYEESIKKLQKCGVIEKDSDGLVKSMVEKPENPKTHFAVPPFYIYAKNDISMVKQGIKDGCKTDAPGSFIAYLCSKTKVHAMEMPGKRYDIGDLESYKEVEKTYKGIIK